MHLQDQIFLERMSSSKEVRIGTSQNNSSNLLETFALRLDLDFRWDSKAWNSKTQKGYSSILLVDMGGLYNTPSKRFFQREVASVKKKINLSLPIKHLFQRVFLSFFRAKIIYLTNKKTSSFFEFSSTKKNVLCHIEVEQWVWQECDAWVSWSIFNA